MHQSHIYLCSIISVACPIKGWKWGCTLDTSGYRILGWDPLEILRDEKIMLRWIWETPVVRVGGRWNGQALALSVSNRCGMSPSENWLWNCISDSILILYSDTHGRQLTGALLFTDDFMSPHSFSIHTAWWVWCAVQEPSHF